VSFSKIRIQLNCLLKQWKTKSGRRYRLQGQHPSSHKQVVNLDARRASLRRQPCRWQGVREGSDDPVHDVILKSEDILEIAVEPVGPNVPTTGGVDELNRYAHARCRTSYATFYNVGDSKLAGSPAHIDISVLVDEGGMSCDHEQASDFGEIGDQIF
jgi:hypothetical protein